MKKINFFMIAAFALLTSSAFAANVAKIGDTEYATFEEAFNAMKSGETLQLIADATLDKELVKGTSGKLPISGTYTIDLGGYSLTALANLTANPNGWDGVLTFYNVNVTIKNGTIKDDNNALGSTIEIVNNTKALMQDVTMTFHRAGSKNFGAICCDNDETASDVTLNNVKISSDNGMCIQVSGGSASINNCEFTYNGDQDKTKFGYTALAVSGGAQVTVNKGTYTSTNYCVYILNSGGECIINDGIFSGASSVLRIDNSKNSTDYKGHDNYSGGSVMEVNGGTFTGAIQNTTAENNSGFAIRGGNFSVEPLAKYVPSDCEIKVEGGEYIVSKKVETTITINDNTGKNDSVCFKLTAETELTNTVTKAKYVEVAGTEIAPAKLTVKAGQTLNVGDDGLNIRPNAQVVVEAGAVLTVGSYGVITSNEESIIIESNGSTTGSYLIDPTTSYNTQPQATVKMVANVGQKGTGYKWHRFASPVKNLTEAWTKSPNYATALYEWDYAKSDWKATAGGSTGMKPFLGYTLTTNQPIEDVTYTFKGQLIGNANSGIDFTNIGWGYFGNSYTGYIASDKLLMNIFGLEGVEGTVWTWNATSQTYYGASLSDIQKGKALPVAKEIAPMQTFILKLNSGDGANLDIDYASAIWGNPRYNLVTPTAAPARADETAAEDDAYFMLSVAGGEYTDYINMTENQDNSDAYENGVDAEKLMNAAPAFNIYSTVSSKNHSSLYTNNLLGKQIILAAQAETNYTLKVESVTGKKYALKDLVTNQIIDLIANETYSFTATAQSTAARFEVVANPSSINEVSAGVKANKMLKNGKLVIIRGDKQYNAIGQQL